jgi:hypothetical protein
LEKEIKENHLLGTNKFIVALLMVYLVLYLKPSMFVKIVPYVVGYTLLLIIDLTVQGDDYHFSEYFLPFI